MVPAMDARRAWLGVAGALALVIGCGPSFQAVYEGDQRFEHCYALDESPSVPLDRKSACWRDWATKHTYGQTRDRVEYAAARHRALTRIREMPTDEAIMQAAPGGAERRSSVSAPAPTSAFAPPPRMMEADAGAAQEGLSLGDVPTDWTAGQTSNAPSGGAGPRPPGAECLEACGMAFRSCNARGDGGVTAACDKDYRGCARTCVADRKSR